MLDNSKSLSVVVSDSICQRLYFTYLNFVSKDVAWTVGQYGTMLKHGCAQAGNDWSVLVAMTTVKAQVSLLLHGYNMFDTHCSAPTQTSHEP